MNTARLSLKSNDITLMRLYYFLFFAGNGLILPFVNLFFAEIGLTGAQIGLIAAVAAGVTLVVAPIWTRKSEQSQRPKELLQIALFLTAISCLLLGYQHLFIGVLIVSLFRALVNAGIWPLSDAIALSVIGDTKTGFGSVRVWGSAGWIVVGLFSGWLIQQGGWVALFGMTALCYLLTALTLSPIGGVAFATDTSQKRVSRELLQRLYKHPLLVGMGALLIFSHAFNTGVLQFEYIFLAELGASKSLIGIIGILGAIVEIPCMFWVDRVIRRKGTISPMLVGIFLYCALRFLILIWPSIPAIMISRGVGGVAFGFFTIAQISFFAEHIGPQDRRTVLALYNVTLISLISVIAPPITGAIYDRFGAHWLYGVAAVGYFLAGLSLWYGWQIYKRNKPKGASFTT